MNTGETYIYESVEGSVEHNLQMMNTEMKRLLMSESVGGNGGVLTIEGKHYSGAGANGYVDQEGRIVAFGNIQDLPESVTKETPFTLRVAFDIKRLREGKNPFFKIVDLMERGNFTEEMRRAIDQAVEMYNTEHNL